MVTPRRMLPVWLGLPVIMFCGLAFPAPSASDSGQSQEHAAFENTDDPVFVLTAWARNSTVAVPTARQSARGGSMTHSLPSDQRLCSVDTRF